MLVVPVSSSWWLFFINLLFVHTAPWKIDFLKNRGTNLPQLRRERTKECAIAEMRCPLARYTFLPMHFVLISTLCDESNCDFYVSPPCLMYPGGSHCSDRLLNLSTLHAAFLRLGPFIYKRTIVVLRYFAPLPLDSKGSRCVSPPYVTFTLEWLAGMLRQVICGCSSPFHLGTAKKLRWQETAVPLQLFLPHASRFGPFVCSHKCA